MTHSVFDRMVANEPAARDHPKPQEFSFFAASMADVAAFLAASESRIQSAKIERAHSHIDVSFTSHGWGWDHFRRIAEPWRMIRDTLSLDSEEP